MQACNQRWIVAAVLYFVVAVGLGVYMGASGDHSLHSVHAHLNLLGWVSLAIIGLIYHAMPAAGESRLASIQFWLHNLSLPVMMLFLALLMKGNAAVEPLVGIASVVMLVAVVLFATNVWRHRG
jgi:hypothetical protein